MHVETIDNLPNDLCDAHNNIDRPVIKLYGFEMNKGEREYKKELFNTLKIQKIWARPAYADLPILIQRLVKSERSEFPNKIGVERMIHLMLRCPYPISDSNLKWIFPSCKVELASERMPIDKAR